MTLFRDLLGSKNRSGLLEAQSLVGYKNLRATAVYFEELFLEEKKQLLDNSQRTPQWEREYPRPYHLDLGMLLGPLYLRNLFVAPPRKNIT